jgi:hypothetical protein
METVYKRELLLVTVTETQTVLDSKGQTQWRRYHQTALDSLPRSERIEPERGRAKFRSNHGPYGIGRRCPRVATGSKN